jgi:hypothetical protein
MSESLETIAWRLAVNCRRIVQACLREEEWRDADQEFFAVIVNELRPLWPFEKASKLKAGDEK